MLKLEEMKMAVMMDDCQTMMQTGRCPTCGSIVFISSTAEGDIEILCPTCKAQFGFSPGFFY